MKTDSGLLVILSGPAGAGKTTLARRLCEHHDDCTMSISATTRAPRGSEAHGRDYFFYTREEFEEQIEAGEFAEYAEFSTNYYGTPISFLNQQMEAGRNVILDIEVKGAAQLRRHYPNAVKIFILPPSPEVLIERLQGRQTDSAEEIARRMEIARTEVMRLEEYDYCITNDCPDEAFRHLEAILQAEQFKVRGGECERWLDGRSAEEVLKVAPHAD
ncbi:MAG: guanylate kinase [Planctomycetota bacterium]|jgi:guanylate kinase